MRRDMFDPRHRGFVWTTQNTGEIWSLQRQDLDKWTGFAPDVTRGAGALTLGLDNALLA